MRKRLGGKRDGGGDGDGSERDGGWVMRRFGGGGEKVEW